jgi:hypothetical protein
MISRWAPSSVGLHCVRAPMNIDADENPTFRKWDCKGKGGLILHHCEEHQAWSSLLWREVVEAWLNLLMRSRRVGAPWQISMDETAIPTQFPHPNFRIVVGPADPTLQPAEMGETLELFCLLAPGS